MTGRERSFTPASALLSAFGISQADLSKTTGYSKGSISRQLGGDQLLSEDLVEAIRGYGPIAASRILLVIGLSWSEVEVFPHWLLARQQNTGWDG